MADKLTPRTSIERGPPAEEPIDLDTVNTEHLAEAGGDTEAVDVDANVGGASATAGLDSGGAVGVRRGPAVGRPGAEYDSIASGETTMDVPAFDRDSYDMTEEEIEAASAEGDEAAETPGIEQPGASP